jgi:hypothetical protein
MVDPRDDSLHGDVLDAAHDERCSSMLPQAVRQRIELRGGDGQARIVGGSIAIGRLQSIEQRQGEVADL